MFPRSIAFSHNRIFYRIVDVKKVYIVLLHVQPPIVPLMKTTLGLPKCGLRTTFGQSRRWSQYRNCTLPSTMMLIPGVFEVLHFEVYETQSIIHLKKIPLEVSCVTQIFVDLLPVRA